MQVGKARMSHIAPVWTIEQARNFCNALNPQLRELGYCIGITGGVLFAGSSIKDLDVIIYPLKKRTAQFSKMYNALASLGLTYERKAGTFKDNPNSPSAGFQDDGKRVEVWNYRGKRIDLFFLA